MTYGYDSHPTDFFDAAINQIVISRYGLQLLEQLNNHRCECVSRPLVFVAYSLGGILVKAAMLNLNAIHSASRKRLLNFVEL